MKVTFLGQGFTQESPDSVGVYINKLLADDAYTSFFCIAAFASPLGIKLLDSFEQAKQFYTEINIIVGVDQNGTSQEALEEIIKLDVNSFVFYQRESPIFHPKIYLFEGKEDICLIVGSSNLTGKGLFSNIESSIMIQCKNSDQEGLKVVMDMKNYFKPLFNQEDPNLFPLDQDLILALVKDGIVPNEKNRSRQHGKKTASIESTEKRNTKIPDRSFSKIPVSKLRRKSTTYSEEPTSREELELIGNLKDSGELVSHLLWESGPLTERDLNIPTGSNTNPTGSMLFKKGKMRDIDQRHFFRDDVFASLDWIRDTRLNFSHLERASALFQIIIKGRDHGVFSLALTHNTRIDTASYRQKNSMTSVSWGESKKIVAKRDLIGSSAKLYRNQGVKSFFTIEIS